MPHDKNGNTLERGDTVTVAFTITEIHPSDDYCNASLLTTESMYPGTDKTYLTINTRQCELQTKGRPSDLPMTTDPEPCEPYAPPLSPGTGAARGG